ncbi:uncharacterized protein BN813_00757 [Bacteroides sp. CAG:927]|nr:uncharacterized protein BN813_00757 [Bacteroides sp. CAG:927]
MGNTNNIIRLDSIDTYNKLYGLDTYNPLATVIDLKQAKNVVNHVNIDYNVYAVFFKNEISCKLRYGLQPYDYQDGTVVCFSPGQIIGIDSENDEIRPDVVGVLFHPDLIYRTPLGDKISRYSFFDYSEREALHLSGSEKALFMECLDRIKREVEYPIDNHSSDVISSQILVLLDYLARFYERQFITRKKANSAVISMFEKNLKEYYESGRGYEGIPTVSYFAELANLTPGYFGDLVKKGSGATAQEFIANYVVLRAKHRLASTNDDISIIAYELGFQHPQHFARLFKRITKQSPTEFRKQMQKRNQ